MTITLTLNPQTLSEGQTISGSSFVSSVTDSAHRSITEYSVYDSGADGGYFVLNGVKLADGAWHTLTAAQFAQLQYVAGSGAGSETISIKAYDGKPWSSAYSTTARRRRRPARRRASSRCSANSASPPTYWASSRPAIR